MPITTAYETRIDHVSILDEHGVFDETLGKDLIPEDQLPAIMEHLVFCRQLDETAFKLQRSGRMGTYPQNTGVLGIGPHPVSYTHLTLPTILLV